MTSSRLGCLALASALTLTCVTPAFAQSAPTPAPTTAPAPAPAPAPATSETPEIDRETPEQRDSRQLARAWGWLFTGIGSASAALAVGTSILMLQDASNRSNNCTSAKVCNAAGLTANSQLGDLGPWNAAFWIVGAAGLGVGITLLVTHPSDESKGMRLQVMPTTSGASLGLRGAF